jgi:hypothetical protein
VNFPALNPARVGIVTHVYLSGSLRDRLPLLFISLASDGLDIPVPVGNLDPWFGAHVVVPAWNVRLAEVGPDDREVFANRYAQQRCNTALPCPGTSRGDGHDRKPRNNTRHSHPAPAKPQEDPIDVMQGSCGKPGVESCRGHVLHRHLRSVGSWNLVPKGLDDPHRDSVTSRPGVCHHKEPRRRLATLRGVCSSYELQEGQQAKAITARGPLSRCHDLHIPGPVGRV